MTTKEPTNPHLVLAAAMAAPGAGHVMLGLQPRGLGFAFFSLLLALFCWHTTGPEISFIGRAAGGLFVWALSVTDAYRIARLRHEIWRQGKVAPQENSIHSS